MARPFLRAALALWLLAQPVAHAQGQPPTDLVPSVAFEAPPPPLLAEIERRRVLLDDSPQDGNRSAARALVLFDRPRAEVLRLLASTQRQREYRPELTRLDVIEASEKGDVAEYRVRFMLTTLIYRARHGWDFGSGRVWWTLDPSFSNDLKALDGLWELLALGDRTLGRFTTRIDLGPALPQFLQDYATRTKLPESMDEVRHWIDSGGKWRP